MIKRFNFLQREPNVFVPNGLFSFPRVETSRRTQHAFVLCATVAVLCSFLSLWERTQWRVAQLETFRSEQRLDRAYAQLAQLHNVTNVIEESGENARRIGEVRGRTAERLNRIAALGDRIAPAVWLVHLSEDGADVRVTARARTAGDIGRVLGNLHAIRGLSAPQMGNMHSLAHPGASAVEFSLDLKEQGT